MRDLLPVLVNHHEFLLTSGESVTVNRDWILLMTCMCVLHVGLHVNRNITYV